MILVKTALMIVPAMGVMLPVSTPAALPPHLLRDSTQVTTVDARIRAANRLAQAVEAQVTRLEQMADKQAGGSSVKSLLRSLSDAQRAAKAYRKSADEFENLLKKLEVGETEDARLDKLAELVADRASKLAGAVQDLVSTAGRARGRLVSDYLAALRSTLEYLPETPERTHLDDIEELLRQVGTSLYASLAPDDGAQGSGSSSEVFARLTQVVTVSSKSQRAVLAASDVAEILDLKTAEVERLFEVHFAQADNGVHNHPRYAKLHKTWRVVCELKEQPWTLKTKAEDNDGKEHEGTVGELLTLFLDQSARLAFNGTTNKESLSTLGRQLHYLIDEQEYLRGRLAADR